MMSFALCHICHFNSRLRKETNYYDVYIEYKEVQISTHVSARRRTDSYYLEYCAREFQLASLQGDELSYQADLSEAYAFQFTSPYGDEQYGLSPITVWCHFNSRLRKETNSQWHFFLFTATIFQFTSPQGDERKLLLK